MYLNAILEKFATKSPVSVMVRATLENALAPAALDAVFTTHADLQYERELMFSSVVDLMGMVVTKVQPSLNAAYQAVADTLPVSLTSVYNKLNGLEPQVTAALVHHTAKQLAPVIQATGGSFEPWLPGYRVRILDGNHLAATERRLDVLRDCKAGPLPGQSLVVLAPEVMLATEMIPCEDGHAQERSMTSSILGLVQAGDCWVADRNFCTMPLLRGIEEQQGFFVIRHHANVPVLCAGTLQACGRTETGQVFEQAVTVGPAQGPTLHLRRIVVQLDKPTRDGDDTMAILTNLPVKDASAVAVADVYRKRWTLETLFFELTQMLHGELATMGYPRAALFGFAMALVSYNILSVVKASLRAAFGHEKVENDVSGYYIANEVRATQKGMDIVVEHEAWVPFQAMTPESLARELVRLAGNVRLAAFKRHPRGPKKPPARRTKYADKPHVSTARLLSRIPPPKSP